MTKKKPPPRERSLRQSLLDALPQAIAEFEPPHKPPRHLHVVPDVCQEPPKAQDEH